MSADKFAADDLTTGKNILSALGAGAATGVGGMALYHLLRAMKSDGRKEQRYRNAATQAPVLVKSANQLQNVYDNVARAIGSVPGKITDNLGLLAWAGPQNTRDALSTTAALSAGLAGLYGGGKLVNNIVAHKDKKDAQDDVEEARKQYYAILSGQNKSAAVLDSAFDKLATTAGFLDSVIPTVLHTATTTVPRGLITAQLLASLGAAGIGAKYMYDRTAARTRGENTAKAQESRARMRALPSVYVDPDELARVKQLAEQKPQ